jgi:hypothetical protein
MTKERPTLGGAIILRKESELLAKAKKIFKINLIINRHKYSKENFEKYFKEVFSSSKYNFQISYDFSKKIYWPKIKKNSDGKLSYITFLRLNKLVKKYKIRPILEWDKETLIKAKKIRKKFPKKLIAVHLKNVFPYKKKESNANGKIWDKFFKYNLKNKKFNFLLIGNDEISSQISLNKNIFLAKKFNIPIKVQLCLVSMCDAFLGMASGPSVAANFTNIPYYIFKHPAHDKSEMKKEIGNSNKLKFAKKNQILLRKMPSLTILKKISSNYYERIQK